MMSRKCVVFFRSKKELFKSQVTLCFLTPSYVSLCDKEIMGCHPNLLGDFIPKPHLRFAIIDR